MTRDPLRDSSHHTQHGAPACQRDEWSLRQLLPSGSDPGDQELQHDVELDVLHLHQVAEGDGLQGEPEEVPLARPQQVERPEGEEGKGTTRARYCLRNNSEIFITLLSLKVFAHIYTYSRLLYKTGFTLEELLVIAMILTP